MTGIRFAALAALFAAWSAPAAADFAGALCTRARGSHVDVLTSTYSQACFGHIERDADGTFVRVVALPEPMSGDVRASKDTRVVVYVASYLSLSKAEALAQDPVVVRVYRDGALVREQRLSEIATAADLRASISHVSFTKEIADAVVDDALVLVTISGKRVVIDTRVAR